MLYSRFQEERSSRPLTVVSTAGVTWEVSLKIQTPTRSLVPRESRSTPTDKLIPSTRATFVALEATRRTARPTWRTTRRRGSCTSTQQSEENPFPSATPTSLAIAPSPSHNNRWLDVWTRRRFAHDPALPKRHNRDGLRDRNRAAGCRCLEQRAWS